ncbi:MAG: hypothetical protein AABY83_11420 [Pseudomonadota bacterium]
MRNALAIIIVYCAGCATLEPQPEVEPTLKGSMENGVYRSMDGRFKIALPQRAQDHRKNFMQITEQYGEHSSVVNFGPMADSHSSFHLELIHKTTLQSRMVKLRHVVRPMLDGLLAHITQEYGVRPIGDLTETLVLAGREALHWRFFQTLSQRNVEDAHTHTLHHEIFIIDFPDDTAVIWVQVDPDKYPIESGLMAQQFASSLTFE